jgi:hypothetical protein
VLDTGLGFSGGAAKAKPRIKCGATGLELKGLEAIREGDVRQQCLGAAFGGQ